MDGSLIGEENYTAEEGSTIITLKEDYLKTLSMGSHTFEIVWTDGTAETTFTITENDNNKKDGNTAAITAPKTADNTQAALWMTIMVAVIAEIIWKFAFKKRKDCL